MKQYYIKVAFFKGSGSILSKLVKAVTNSRYSHSEIIIGNYWYGANINLTGFSGVTKIYKPKISKSEWDIVSIKVTQEEFHSISDLANGAVGKGYSFKNALLSVFKSVNVDTDDEYFCSNLVTYFLTKSKILKMHNKPVKTTPADLYTELHNKMKYTKKALLKLNISDVTKREYSMESLYLTW